MSEYDRHGLGKPWRGYYLTAYGLAVKHGFEGTEEEWLASLVGAAGEAVELQFNEETNTLQIKYESETEWTDLMSLDDLQSAVEAATLASATAAQEAAETAAAEAADTLAAVQAIEVETETLEPGSEATATTGTSAGGGLLIQFGIPQGATGATGPQGETGATGATGAQGPQGEAATISVGTVTTGTAGSSASVTNSGTAGAAVFDFTIPRGNTGATGATGATGPQGEQGEKGDTGDAATISVGTVTTGAAGSSAKVTNSGTTSAAVFNFTIPKGDTGETGEQGPQGEKGETGSGFTVLGYYTTLAALESGQTSPEAGDAYGVGTGDPYDIYIWDGVNSVWVNNGSIQGAKGDTGEAATVSVGTVTTGAAGTSASVTNSGTTSAAVFDFVIPQGATGPQGEQGEQGEQGIQGEQGPQGETGPQGEQGEKGDTGATGAAGAAATISVGTVTTGAAGSSAGVTNSGTTSAAVFNFTIPRGDTGATGAQGEQGPQGEKGETGEAGAKGCSFQITLAAASWSGTTITATDSRLIADGYCYIIAPDTDSYESYAAALIRASAVTTDGSITFTASEAPEEALTVNVLRIEAEDG